MCIYIYVCIYITVKDYQHGSGRHGRGLRKCSSEGLEGGKEGVMEVMEFYFSEKHLLKEVLTKSTSLFARQQLILLNKALGEVHTFSEH